MSDPHPAGAGDPAAVYRRIMIEVVGNGDVALAEQLFDEGFVSYRTGLHTMFGLFGPPRPPDAPLPGLQVFLRGLGLIKASFPDWRLELHRVVADGDVVAGNFTVHASFTGDAPFMGFLPTGRAFTFAEAGILTIRDGRAVDGWFVGDELAFAHAVTDLTSDVRPTW